MKLPTQTNQTTNDDDQRTTNDEQRPTTNDDDHDDDGGDRRWRPHQRDDEIQRNDNQRATNDERRQRQRRRRQRSAMATTPARRCDAAQRWSDALNKSYEEDSRGGILQQRTTNEGTERGMQHANETQHEEIKAATFGTVAATQSVFEQR